MEEPGEQKAVVPSERSQLPYDPDVEKKRIEAQERIVQRWQETISNIGTQLVGVWKEGKIAEYRNVMTLSKWIIVVCILFFVGIGVLVYFGKVSGDALVFLTGIIVGYLLGLLTPKPRKETS